MESDVTQSAIFYKLLAWGEARKKQLLGALATIVVVGLAIAFWFTHQNQQQSDANDALSKLVIRNVPGPAATAQALLRVAGDYPSTEAGQRAALLGASDLYTQGKYDEARAEFQKFLQEHADSPFAGEAALGVASSLDAQGKAEDAIGAYRSIENHYQNWAVVPQAKLALARLLEAQGKFQDAKAELEDVLHSYPGQIGAEAGGQLQELMTAHPETVPVRPPMVEESPIVMPTNRPTVPVIPTNHQPATGPIILPPSPTTKQ